MQIWIFEAPLFLDQSEKGIGRWIITYCFRCFIAITNNYFGLQKRIQYPLLQVLDFEELLNCINFLY